MMRPRHHGLVLLLLLLPLAARSELYGYLEARWLRADGAGEAVPGYVTAERIRPTLVEPVKSLKGVTVTATPQVLITQREGRQERYDDAGDYLTVERLYADVDAGPARLRIGRQAVNWGSALIWNPTDLFEEVFLTDYWAERKGLNAVRVYVPMREEFRLTAVAATGDTVWSHNRYGVKASLARWRADMSVVWMDDVANDRLVWGLDVKGTAILGYWVEAAAFAPKNPDVDPYQQAVLGVDYSFPVLGTLYVAGQYYYNGQGRAHADAYDWAALATGRQPNLAMHYASLIATLAATPDLSVAMTSIVNLDDSTWLMTPYLIYTWRDFRVTAGANIFAGPEGGEYRPHNRQSPGNFIPRAVYYAWGRWYF
jgi:hypothetical protein